VLRDVERDLAHTTAKEPETTKLSLLVLNVTGLGSPFPEFQLVVHNDTRLLSTSRSLPLYARIPFNLWGRGERHPHPNSKHIAYRNSMSEEVYLTVGCAEKFFLHTRDEPLR